MTTTSKKAPEALEMTEVLGYTTCPSCGQEAAIWATDSTYRVLDCECGYGEIKNFS